MLTPMKSIKYVLFGVALALVFGCTTTFRPWLLSDVKEGMDREQVVTILGAPDSVSTQDEVEYLYYIYTEGYNPSLANGSARAYEADSEFKVQQIQQSFKEHKYAVKLVDGKVQSYKQVQD
jgi:outer membrane protein assembly factor BamE (lipoprotein component of BamABCDE complex)